MVRVNTEPVTVSWEEFIAGWPKQYRQDQHVTVIGPTGSGKTTLVTELIRCRGHVVALGVKHVDATMAKMVTPKRSEWVRVPKWSQRPKNANRIVLWPKVSDLDKVFEIHNKTFSELFRSVYKIGHWTIWIDELTYLADHCGLKKMIRQMYILARSNRISLVGVAQRPAFIPTEAYNQASHLFLYRTGHEADLIKLGSMNGTDAKQVARTVAELPEYTFLHVNLTDGRQTISKVES